MDHINQGIRTILSKEWGHIYLGMVMVNSSDGYN